MGSKERRDSIIAALRMEGELSAGQLQVLVLPIGERYVEHRSLVLEMILDGTLELTSERRLRLAK
jgi:hypothetical protein